MHPDAYAVEVGPYAARFVGSILSDPNRVPLMAARNKAYPNSMAFLDMREENDLAARCAASSHNPHFALWGLDQEFLGSAGTLLQSMAATNPGPLSRATIAAAQAKERTDATPRSQATGDFNRRFTAPPPPTPTSRHSSQPSMPTAPPPPAIYSTSSPLS